MAGELGKASLDLEANLAAFEANIKSGGRTVEGFDRQLGALTSIADVATRALNDVGLSAGKAAESRVSAEEILEGVRGIGEESRAAAIEIDRVKLSEAQASESEASALRMDRALDGVGRNADQARRKLEEVRLAGGRNGVGVGPFGSGFGRIGLLGTAVGVGALAAPAAAPAALGLLGAIPALAVGGAGALGTLALAFDGVTKAIGGNKKAFNDLGPSAKQFVLTVRSLDGWFDKLRQTGGAAVFPGLTAGLKAALSPGTVGTITAAITELGHAIGAAGAAWGRYFGSREFQSIFGPLMRSAARNIGVLSDGFLHLFDALGVLARAAIPFTNWLVDAAAKGAKLVDSWIHAKDASGALGRGMKEAETSLRLVGNLAGALVGAVVALGQALYPVAKVAVKDLTDGLNALSGIIRRNQGLIREIVNTALAALVNAVKDAAKVIGVLSHGFSQLPPVAKVAVMLIAADFALLFTGPAGIVAVAIVALYEIQKHWRLIAKFFVTLGIEIIGAFKYVWYEIEKGALNAALKVVEPFSHLPSFLGGWARKAKDSMQGQLDKLHPPDMNWSDAAARAGEITGTAWRRGFVAAMQKKVEQHANTLPPVPFSFWLRQHPGGTRKEYEAYVKAYEQGQKVVKELTHQHHRKHSHTKSHTTTPTITQPSTTDPFGTLPPFTSTGGAATQHHHHRVTAAQRAQLQLQYQLDKAILAVQKAQVGSRAWDKAIAREETALKAEIHYWDKRAHDAELSKKARDAALRKEIQYERELHSLEKQLLKQTSQAVAQNEQQFLSTFTDIQNAFAPNAMPIAPTGSGKTDTHLHDIKNEARESNRHLKALRTATRFTSSAASLDAAMAVTG